MASQVGLGTAKDSSTRAPAVAREGSRLPILAINSIGSVTKANAPARRVLGGGGQDSLEGANIASLFVDLLARRRGVGRRTALSFLNSAGEREDVLVVLSDSQARQEEGATVGARPIQGTAPDFIAHELRNPLGTIRGLSEILDTRFASLSEDDKHMAIETIRAEADRSLLILEAVLRLAEHKTKGEMDLATVPLHTVVHRVVESHKRRNSHRTVTLSGDSPLFARANSLWVELALSNLISNAEKYTPKDRTIEIAFHQNGSRSTILVMDNGAGLPQERYRALWDLYYRGAHPDLVISGSGIGLALCKELVEGMGGQVWAGPRKSGGSVFALSLPAPWDMRVPASLNTPTYSRIPAGAPPEQALAWA